jgi:hypothetical protein
MFVDCLAANLLVAAQQKSIDIAAEQNDTTTRAPLRIHPQSFSL